MVGSSEYLRFNLLLLDTKSFSYSSYAVLPSLCCANPEAVFTGKELNVYLGR